MEIIILITVLIVYSLINKALNIWSWTTTQKTLFSVKGNYETKEYTGVHYLYTIRPIKDDKEN